MYFYHKIKQGEKISHIFKTVWYTISALPPTSRDGIHVHSPRSAKQSAWEGSSMNIGYIFVRGAFGNKPEWLNVTKMVTDSRE